MRTNDCSEEIRRPGGLELTRRGLDLCGFSAGARIADIGCGAGASVRLLRARGYHALGLDLSAQGGDFPLVRGGAEALPFARASLHGLLCECLLSLLPDPGRVLAGFAEVCRPGGRLLLTDIYLPGGLVTAEERGRTGPLSGRELETALRSAGWRVIYFEDCPRALKLFAARLLWYAEENETGPAARDGDIPWRACGYGLWIAQKEV